MSTAAIGITNSNRPVLAIEGLTVSFDGFRQSMISISISTAMKCTS